MIDVGWYGACLLSVRGMCHLLIFLRVFSYSSGGGHTRKTVGYIAGCFAGANLAEAIRIFSNFADFASKTTVALPAVILGVLVFVTISGGNMSRFLPRKLVELMP